MTECSDPKIQLDAVAEDTIHVLHVDDEVDFLDGAKLALEMFGAFSVDPASSVEEARRMLKKKPYDAIVCDYMMPRKDALQFVKELRDNGNQIPFIIFTGKSREDVAVEALNLGVDRYFSKIGRPAAVYSELALGIRQTVKVRRLELARVEAEELYKSVVELSTDSIVTVNMKGIITSCNPTATKMLGFSKGELVGKHFSDTGTIGASDLQRYKNLLDSVLNGETTQPIALTFHRKDGTTFLAEVRVGLLKGGGKPIGIQAISRSLDETPFGTHALGNTGR
jgi:PAS domain S-box-containing protein